MSANLSNDDPALQARYSTMKRELEAVDAAIESIEKSVLDGNRGRSIVIAHRLSTLVGMQMALRWALFGFETQVPPSVQIGSWRADDEAQGW